MLDVDGVLTAGGIVLGETESGEDVEVKTFSVKDGLGLTLARAAGYRLGILTGRTSRIVLRRARELAFDVIEQGHFDKTAAFLRILEEQKLDASQVMYVGDDLLDLRILARVGFPVAVGDAPELVRDRALYVTRRNGGDGAVREIVDKLLAWTGRQDRAYRALGIDV
ncbi:MAG: HAD hydrolase family protein [Acidobacteriota bacterium]